MSLKNEIIEILEENKGTPISGEIIAKKLSVSRSAIWKNINILKKEGHKIEAVSNKGYTLNTVSDVLTKEGIILKLGDCQNNINLLVFDTVDSTNLQAKKCGFENAVDKSVFVANCQTNGRGRKGRSFFSPSDTGIYMSILLRPEDFSRDTIKVTIAAAVAVVRAIKTVTMQDASIKWVNDIFLNGRKICGILTEAVSDMETGSIDFLVVGVGVNVSTAQFPKEIENIAGAVSEKQISRNDLTAEIIKEFLKLYKDLSSPKILEEYKKSSLVFTKHIKYEKNGIKYIAKDVDINDYGNL
ncbi:MAG: biotin--[acetyl-CoA-carboxylase] ligase, partial [Oscillospiraceae bacterium]